MLIAQKSAKNGEKWVNQQNFVLSKCCSKKRSAPPYDFFFTNYFFYSHKPKNQVKNKSFNSRNFWLLRGVHP